MEDLATKLKRIKSIHEKIGEIIADIQNKDNRSHWKIQVEPWRQTVTLHGQALVITLPLPDKQSRLVDQIHDILNSEEFKQRLIDQVINTLVEILKEIYGKVIDNEEEN